MDFPLLPLLFGRKCQPSSLKFGFDAQFGFVRQLSFFAFTKMP